MSEAGRGVTQFRLTLLTRDAVWAGAADDAGVDRIGVDIERLGKMDRQRAMPGSRISDHELKDLQGIAAVVRRGKLFARLNRPHAGTRGEVEEALACGARALMLPGFRSAGEVEEFVAAVAGRAEVLLLIETREALERAAEIAAIPGVDEVMAGLNDLSIDLDLPGPMAALASEELDGLAAAARGAGRPFGCGGVTHPRDTGLPVPPDLVLARMAVLGAEAGWVARSFFNAGTTPGNFAARIAGVRSRIAWWRGAEREVRDAAAAALVEFA